MTYEGYLFKNVQHLISISYMQQKIQENFFCFLANCSRIGCGKYFLLQREYYSSVVNVLTNTPAISDTLRWIFSNSIFAKVMKKYDGSAMVQIFRLFNTFIVARCSETRFFRHVTNHIFCSL